MNNVLITGGAGFIGSHLVEHYLKKGNSVICLDNFDDFYDYRIKLRNLENATGLKVTTEKLDKVEAINTFSKHTNSEKFTLVYGDIRDEQCVDAVFSKYKIDVVVHLAALAGVRPSIENPMRYADVNIMGSMQLWEACKNYDVTKFVCASSSSVYGNNKTVPFKEEHNVDKAISPYAATKKAAEVMGHVYHSLYHIDMLQLRFFTVYGPRQRPDLAIHKFTRKMHNQETIPFFGDGSTMRDYTYIDDIIDGVVKSVDYVLANENVYEIFNLGESETISLNEMVGELGSHFKQAVKKEMLPKQAGDVDRTFADIAKSKEKLGYQPSTSFRLGIKNFMRWFKENNT